MALRDYLVPDLHWQVFTPELVVLLFALIAPLVALWDTDRRGMKQFTAIGLGGAFLLTLGTLLQWQWTLSLGGSEIPFTLKYIEASASPDNPLANVFMVTQASQLFKLIFLGVAFLAVIGTGPILRGKVREDWGEFYSLLLFATLGMMIVASARELLTLFIGVEIASLSSYLLAGFHRRDNAAEASLKYFVIGAIASGMSLFGISLLYGMAGTTHIPSIGNELTTGGDFDALSVVPILMLLGGLGFKISSVPMHMWAPDVYCGSSPVVAGVLAAASKAMGFAALFSVFLVGLGGVGANWQLVVALIAVATMFVGNLVAVQQDNIRRMLAYSSIAQAGYVLIALAVGTWFAVGGGILHLMVNAAMKLGAFLIIGGLMVLGVSDHLDGWKGMGKRAPFAAFAMTIFLLSLAGLPPFGGFTSKFVLFSSAIDVGVVQHLGWLTWLAVFAVINSAISLYYYLRVIRNMYVEEAEPGAKRLRFETGTNVAVFLCLVLVFVVGIYPQWFIDISMQAAQALLTTP